MQTQCYIIDGVILETSRRVPDSWSSDTANVKMDLKSVTVCDAQVYETAKELYADALTGCMKMRVKLYRPSSRHLGKSKKI